MKLKMNKYHLPVLLKESVDSLNIKSNGIYVDATYGGGGHSKEILNFLSSGLLVGFDQDQASLSNKIMNDKRFVMINANFRYLKKELSKKGIYSIDGLVADLGVSAYHFSDNKRGFSLKYNANIDMRMNQNLRKDGCYVINKYNKEELNRVFKEHADFKRPSVISDEIIMARKINPINTTFELKRILQNMCSKKNANQYFARIFQAIRIEVNDELNALKEMLIQAEEMLVSGGRLVVISYHSLEDVLVKRFMRFGDFSNQHKKDFFGNAYTPFYCINKKPIVPSNSEIKLNNKSRSAKMRICEKK